MRIIFTQTSVLRCITLLVFSVALFAAALFVATPRALAGGGPENVFLVVNERSSSSKLIANHYQNLRNIPEKNVLYLRDMAAVDIVNLNTFRSKILEPVLTAIKDRKLVGTIDYIVYSSDFPTRVSVSAHQELLKTAVGKAFNGKFFAPVASLTSLTYFATSILQDDPTYMDLSSNKYYRIPYNQALATPFSGELLKRYQKATAAIRSKGQDFADGENELLAMSRSNPGQAAVLYQLARFFAVEGDKENSIRYLTRAISMGWRNKTFIQGDKNFSKIKADPLFKGLVDRVPESPSNMIASHGFRNAYNWGPNGMINGDKLGSRYFLSAMLSVTSKEGLSDYDSVGYLTNAVNADFTKPTGTFYFTQTSDVRTKTRFPNFKKAISVLQGLGHQTRIIKQVLPERRDDVLGLTCGTATFDWKTSGSRFVPGAIADNLTSSAGNFSSAAQTKCTEFLKYGAAGACGTVVEPYAIQAKFPHPMIHAHYARGCSLAEAYYQSVWGPYQLILVADPLCQPFAKPLKVDITAPQPMKVVKESFDLEIDASQSLERIAGYEVFLDGVMILRQRDLEKLTLDTVDLADGYHELRVVAIASDAIETRGYAQLPFVTNNKGNSVEFSIAQEKFNLADKIEVTASTNFGNRIVIKQNRKTVGVINSVKGTASVSPTVLGIGKIKLRAYAVGEAGETPVSSAPITIEVNGEISQTPRLN